ncbi:N-acetyltransferase family protein [Isoptericola sp. NPDC055881]
MTPPVPDLVQHTSPEGVPPALVEALTDCWVEVTDAGGAAGFPFAPVDPARVRLAVEAVVRALDDRSARLLCAVVPGRLVGWLVVRRALDPLVAHWGTVHHVQTRPDVRGQGVGAALMREARRVARDEMGLEQLRLSARGGMGLESFYERCGWVEVGRWPGALRLGEGDDRDEVHMLLRLREVVEAPSTDLRMVRYGRAREPERA